MTAPPGPRVPSVLCVGEVMIEMFAGAGSVATLGVAGDTYNTAAYLARLLRGRGWRVAYLTELGTDGFSDRVMAEIDRHGIDGGQIGRRAGGTVGLYAIETDAAGERRFTYWRSDSAARTLFSDAAGDPGAIAARLAGHDVVCLSGITLAILPPPVRDTVVAAMPRVRASGARVVFDSNHRPQLWEDADAARRTAEAMWRCCDIALPSLDDETALFGDDGEAAVLARHRAYGYRLGVLKRGARGPVAIVPPVPDAAWPAAPVVVDTTAAGDSFNAGYMAARLKGLKPVAAAHCANRLAAEVIRHPGAIIPPAAMPKMLLEDVA